MERELSQAFQSPGAIGIDGESVSGHAERKVDDDGGAVLSKNTNFNKRRKALQDFLAVAGGPKVRPSHVLGGSNPKGGRETYTRPTFTSIPVAASRSFLVGHQLLFPGASSRLESPPAPKYTRARPHSHKTQLSNDNDTKDEQRIRKTTVTAYKTPQNLASTPEPEKRTSQEKDLSLVKQEKSCPKSEPSCAPEIVSINSSSLIGIGRKFGSSPMKNASDQDYPKTIDVVVGEGAPTTETGSISTLPTPEKTQPTLNSMPCSLKAESTDGEACFPAQDSSGSIRSFDDCDYDGSDADVTMETVSDAGYLSNGSTYGSSCQSADEYSSETETGDLSTEESETSSYEMIDVDEQDCSNFRSHTGGNKGKRNAGHLNDGCGGNSDNNFGRKKGGSGGDGSDGRRKRARGGNSPLSNEFSDDESEVKLLACPYFKHDPTTCTATAYPDLSRVKGHVLRAHLKPLQCDRCGEFRAGDQGQIRKHLRDNNCEKATEFVPVNEAIVKKGEDLKKTSGKAKTWQRVYMILFECSLEEVPSPYAEPAVKLSPQTEAAVAAESSAAQPPALPQHVQLATINDNGFAEYAQQELSRRISAQLPALIAGELPAIISAYTESMRLRNSASGSTQSSTPQTTPVTSSSTRSQFIPQPIAQPNFASSAQPMSHPISQCTPKTVPPTVPRPVSQSTSQSVSQTMPQIAPQLSLQIPVERSLQPPSNYNSVPSISFETYMSRSPSGNHSTMSAHLRTQTPRSHSSLPQSIPSIGDNVLLDFMGAPQPSGDFSDSDYVDFDLDSFVHDIDFGNFK